VISDIRWPGKEVAVVGREALTTRNSRLVVTLVLKLSILNCLILGIDLALGTGLLERLSTHGGRGELNIVSSSGLANGIDLICGITMPCSVCVQPRRTAGASELSSGSFSSGRNMERRGGYALEGWSSRFRVRRRTGGFARLKKEEAGVGGGVSLL